MQKVKIKSTVQPDHKFISYSAWMKYVRNRNNKALTSKIKQNGI
jgi:hypothetical protein